MSLERDEEEEAELRRQGIDVSSQPSAIDQPYQISINQSSQHNK
jgi:hypothetical protein